MLLCQRDNHAAGSLGVLTATVSGLHHVSNVPGIADHVLIPAHPEADPSDLFAAGKLHFESVRRDTPGTAVGRHSLGEVDTAFWQRVMAVNLDSLFWVTRAALPFLEKAGAASIVNLSSLAGRKGGHAGSLAYSAAKGAVLTWTRALAAELGPKGIRVNAVAPGLILGTRFHATHTTQASADETVRTIPLRRAGTAADVARAIVYLASEYDGFITGATLDINGGVYCA